MASSVWCIVLTVVCYSMGSGMAVRMLKDKTNTTTAITTPILEAINVTGETKTTTTTIATNITVTTTTLVLETTTTTTVTLEGVDFTDKLDVDSNTYTLSNVTYYCCCQMDSKATDVTCELVDASSKPVNKFKTGCGALKGPGFHSWDKIKKLAKYKDFEHAGKCIVPSQKLETLPTTTTTTSIDPEQLVDITEQFVADTKELALGEVSHRCCCQMDSKQADVTCELVDVTSKPVNHLKKGCGGLKGAGFHEWSKIKTLTKYKDLEHAGKCVVPWKMLEAVSSYL